MLLPLYSFPNGSIKECLWHTQVKESTLDFIFFPFCKHSDRQYVVNLRSYYFWWDGQYHRPTKSVHKAKVRNRVTLKEHNEDNINDLLKLYGKNGGGWGRDQWAAWCQSIMLGDDKAEREILFYFYFTCQREKGKWEQVKGKKQASKQASKERTKIEGNTKMRTRPQYMWSRLLASTDDTLGP